MDTEKRKRRKKETETLHHLADHLQDSADLLNNVARRMQAAAQQQQRNNQRVRRINQLLQAALHPRPRTFTYLEYLEFASAEEFKRFRYLTPLTDEEIASVDWNELEAQLLAS